MHFLAISALVGAALAQKKGFNYGATDNSGAVRSQQDFENEFNRAKNLQGQSGFTSARLYTMIQGGTANTPSYAIPAAIDTQTSLLLGLWGSAGQDAFNQELTALSSAIKQYGTDFTDLIDGISVGSEDLYRITPTGIENKSGAGAGPADLVSYITQVRNLIKGTAASDAKVGHVDTWTAWVNGSNSAVITAVDWLGVDGYPYYQTTEANGIENGASLFFASYDATVGVAGGKPVWVTETGWPVQGPTAGQAVASVQNAETYWQAVACKLLAQGTNTYWFTLNDPQASTSDISFSVVGPALNDGPLYNLACNGSSSSSSTSSSSAKPSSTAAAPTMPSVSSGASTVSIKTSPNEESAPSTAVSPPAQSSAAAPSVTQGADGTYTVRSTTMITVTACNPQYVTSCPASCSASSAPAPSGSAPAPVSSSAPAPSASSGAKSCPTNLSGDYQYPHLIVPVSSSSPNKAYGTSYNGTITPTESTIVNFDIPQSYAGKTCSLVFLFPQQKDLETSGYTFNGKGGLKFDELASPATADTTYANAPKAQGAAGSIPALTPGNGYAITSHECGAGQRVAFEISSTGGAELNYFQDYNPSPLGAYITTC